MRTLYAELELMLDTCGHRLCSVWCSVYRFLFIQFLRCARADIEHQWQSYTVHHISIYHLLVSIRLSTKSHLFISLGIVSMKKKKKEEIIDEVKGNLANLRFNKMKKMEITPNTVAARWSILMDLNDYSEDGNATVRHTKSRWRLIKSE